MSRLLYSVCVLYFLSMSPSVHALTVYAKLSGDVIEWSSAKLNGDEIQPLYWQPSDKFNMLPIKRWSPAFYKNNQNTLTFSSVKGGKLTTKFEHTGIDFRTSVNPEKTPGIIGSAQRCRSEAFNGQDINLRGNSSCGVNYTLDQGEKFMPFEFYRPSFKLPSIIDDFRQANLPAGKYVASFKAPVAYYLVYENNQVDSYQIYQDEVNVVIDYRPSYLDSVQVLGDGVFNVDYHTDNHTAEGYATYRVQVNGYINPGIKMSFESSGQKDDFSLVNQLSTSKIPYDLSLVSPDFGWRKVIKNGKKLPMVEDYVNIEFEGRHLQMKFNFSFNNVQYGEVDEGDYSDAVTVMFELDI